DLLESVLDGLDGVVPVLSVPRDVVGVLLLASPGDVDDTHVAAHHDVVDLLGDALERINRDLADELAGLPGDRGDRSVVVGELELLGDDALAVDVAALVGALAKLLA